MNDFVIEAENITFSYSHKGPKVLDDISLGITRGTKTAILGANGAGKSTLFSILNALNKPDSGRVLYNGEPLTYRKKDIIRMRSDVSILFQNPNDMIFKPYVMDDVAFGPTNMKLPKDEVDRRVDDALFIVGMSEFKNSPIMKLSYGQRKRITLAGVLAMHPKVLIMDEPTAGLDPQMAYEVMEIAEQLNCSGVTVVMSSHDTDLMYTWTDEIHVLRNGKCVYSGSSDGFYSDRVSVYNSGLLCPSAFLLNEGFSGQGSCSREPLPRTLSQISAKIASASGKEFGTLNIVEVGPDADIKSIIEGYGKDTPVGIYGLSARHAFKNSDAKVDFVYDGPESCTMKCLSGKDSLLICDPQMTGSATTSAEYINDAGYGRIDIKTTRA